MISAYDMHGSVSFFCGWLEILYEHSVRIPDHHSTFGGYIHFGQRVQAMDHFARSSILALVWEVDTWWLALYAHNRAQDVTQKT